MTSALRKVRTRTTRTIARFFFSTRLSSRHAGVMRDHAIRACAIRLIWLLAALVLISPGLAEAERKVVILRVEGKVDAFTRKQIEYQLLEIARRVDPKASQVDFSFSDAAAVSNCTGDLAKCKEAVLEEFGVDEMLIGTAEPMPPRSLSVTVRRASKGKPIQTTTFTAVSDTLDAEVVAKVGPWYGAAPKSTTEPVPTKPPPSVSTTAPRPTTAEPAPTTRDAPDLSPAAPERQPPGPAIVEPAVESTSTRSDVDGGVRVGRGYVVGAIGGGVLATVGLVLWSSARSTQDEIDRAPIGTAAELRRLQDLEATGRSYALWGNVAVITGVAVGAACGYLYWRERRRARSQVAIVPTVHAHGVGLTLTFGGLP